MPEEIELSLQALLNDRPFIRPVTAKSGRSKGLQLRGGSPQFGELPPQSLKGFTKHYFVVTGIVILTYSSLFVISKLCIQCSSSNEVVGT